MRWIKFIPFLVLLASVDLHAQKTARSVRIDGDSLFAKTVNGTMLEFTVGNVVFRDKETIIYCDSAVRNTTEDVLELFGSIRINDGDSVRITSNRLIYESLTRMVRLRGNVVFRRTGQATLYTDFLDYDRMRQEARYYEGGKLVDSTNVLTSVKGYYLVNTGMASFKTNVVANSPDYTLESDTLQYNTRTNIIYFRDQTKLTDKEDGTVANYDQGEYDTNRQKSELNLGQVETLSYLLSGLYMVTDDLLKIYTASGEVELISKEQNVIINGDDGFYDKKEGIAKVYGNALMRKVLQMDTLYMRADTLIAIESADPTKERVLAYPNVKIWKTDLQGISDSLAYVSVDSVIHFYQDPVLWTGKNQMTGDTIMVEIRNNTIDKMNMVNRSFVVSEDTLGNFNQVKGKSMTAFFDQGEIRRVNVNGNAESHFFALDDSESVVIGMNKSISSRMLINFKLNQVDNVSFLVKPDAHMIPPHELESDQKYLDGFSWQNDQRPNLEEVVMGRNIEIRKKSRPPRKEIDP
jgi:lipopolysaccharide export system protein LptA